MTTACGYCEKALTRLAMLAWRLQKLGALGHRGHPGDRFDRCTLEPCRETAEALRYAGLTRSVTCPNCRHQFAR